MRGAFRRVLDAEPCFTDFACHSLTVAVSDLCGLVYNRGPLTDAERAELFKTLEVERKRLDMLNTFCELYRDHGAK